MQVIHLAKLQYIRHATHSITSQYMYAYASIMSRGLSNIRVHTLTLT
jgi:hypothetical protein